MKEKKYYPEFGALVQKLRKAKGWDQYALGLNSTVGGNEPKSFISGIENAKRPNLGVETITKLAKCLDISRMDLEQVGAPQPRMGSLPEDQIRNKHMNFSFGDLLPFRVIHNAEIILKIAKLITDRPIVLCGVPGVGKTTTAFEFAKLNAEKYDAIWLVDAADEMAIKRSVYNLGLALGWIEPSDELEAGFAHTKRILEAKSDLAILLIYDSAQTAHQIQPYLSQSQSTHAILTSNSHVWGKVAQIVNIGFWHRTDSIKYLQEITNIEDPYNANILADALGDLPLALSHAASYCEYLGIDYIDYIERLQANPHKLLTATTPLNQTSAWSTLELALQELKNININAFNLMRMAAFFGNEPIPTYFISHKVSDDGDILPDYNLDIQIAQARNFALLTKQNVSDEIFGDVVSDCINLHPLISLILNSTPKEEFYERQLHQIQLLLPADIDHNHLSWPLLRRLRPHFWDIVESANNCLGPDAINSLNDLAFKMAAFLSEGSGAHDEAIKIYKFILEYNKKYGTNCTSFNARIHNNLGRSLFSIEKFEEAEAAFTTGLNQLGDVSSENWYEFAITTLNLARTLRALKDLAAARQFITRSKTVSNNFANEDQSGFLDAQLSVALALILIDEKKWNEAISVLEIENNQFGEDGATDEDLKTMALLRSTRAIALLKSQDFDAAIADFEIARETSEGIFGVKHQAVNRIVYHLSCAHLGIGNEVTANKLCFIAHDNLKRSIGVNHSWTKEANALQRQLNGV